MQEWKKRRGGSGGGGGGHSSGGSGGNSGGHHKKRGKTTSHEPPIYRSQATLRSFDSGSYTATITLARSPDTAISGVPVSRAIGSSLLTAGKTLAVIFFDHHNSNDGMVVGVF